MKFPAAFWVAVVYTVALYVVLVLAIVYTPESVPTEGVTVSCPVGTVQIAKIDGVWSCIQEGEAG